MSNRFIISLFFCIIPFALVKADGFNTIARTNASLKKALEASKKKDYRQAVKAYEEALREDPDLPAQTRLNLAHACFQSGQLQKAKKNYQAALPDLANESQKSTACLQVGNIFSKERDFKSAIEWYQKSLLHDPDNRKARLNYELAWRLQKEKESEEKRNQPEKNPSQNQNKEKQEKQNQPQKQANPGEKQDPNQPESKSEKNQQKNKSKEPQGSQDENGKKQEDKQNQESDKKGKNGEETDPQSEGENSKKKTQESNLEDPEAYRMDKQKLRESGLTEEQARNMLQAMRQSEVKYLQQKRFKGKSSGKVGRRW